jgi:hypothetical protein
MIFSFEALSYLRKWLISFSPVGKSVVICDRSVIKYKFSLYESALGEGKRTGGGGG